MEQKQQKQKHSHATCAVLQKFQEGEEVYVRDFRPGHTWLPDKIAKYSSPVSYKVQSDNDQIVHRHQDHLRKQSTPVLIMMEDTSTGNPIVEAAPRQPQRNPHRTWCRPDRYTS